MKSKGLLLLLSAMGGDGTWVIGSKYPERFARLLPISGSYRDSEADVRMTVVLDTVHSTVPNFIYREPAVIDWLLCRYYEVFKDVPYDLCAQMSRVPTLLVRKWLVEESFQPVEDELQPEIEVGIGVVARLHRMRCHPMQVRVCLGGYRGKNRFGHLLG